MAHRPAPEPPEVHLWRAPLGLGQEVRAILAEPLSQAECDRARRFRSEDDQARFKESRGWLRLLLGSYLDADPVELAFTHGANGKPRLERPDAPWLRFNLSRTRRLAVFAVANGREVGVDIEQVRPNFPFEMVACRFFTGQEREVLAQLPSATARVDAFYALWTRKEAYLKGIGVGFMDSELEFHAGVRVPATVDRGDRGPSMEQLRAWSCSDFRAGVGYAAAVAVQGGQVQIPGVAQDLSLPET